ncbi:MAG: succinate dehydrogenase cytochrome b subunit [Acidimicrobiia bacterium]|nr:succinate dehydrogenase cytochrome b subunit [Acidimicrobiia bacterium]MDX2467591.1 succinate dehydrogenase cytochrome b subunit [Acidimicrobiia bacterium]
MTTTGRRKDTKPARKLPWILEFYRSDVAKKWTMAVSGIILLGYIAAHMVGNMKVYLGPEPINEYGHALRELGGHLVPEEHLLWIMRIGLAIAFGIHVHAAYSLTRKNLAARGKVRYDVPREYLAANYASRTMRYSGVIVLLFIAFHVADLTIGTTNPDHVSGDIYNNMVASFERLPVAIAYIVANLALGFHIFHGVWSLFQRIGANNQVYNKWRRYLAWGFTAVIIGGNLSFPIAVQLGIIS